MQFGPLQNCAKLVQSYNYGLEGSSKALEIQSDGFALVALPDGRWATTERSGRVSVVGEVLQTPGVRTAALPNGRMATGSANGIVHIWDLDTKECVHELKGHRDMVCSMSVMPGSRLAVASYKTYRTNVIMCNFPSIAVWNYDSGELLAGHQHPLYVLVALPGDLLATGGIDNKIAVVDAMSGVQSYVLSGHSSSLASLCAMPNNKLASGSHDCTVRVWDLETCSCWPVTSRVNALVLLPDGKLASAGDISNAGVCDGSQRPRSGGALSGIQRQFAICLLRRCASLEVMPKNFLC